MNIKDMLNHKNIIFTELIEEGVGLRKRWEEEFTSKISKSQKQKIKFKSFLWHVFSFKNYHV